MKVQLRERSFGEILGQVFSLAGHHFVPLIAIIGIFQLPLFFVQYASNLATTGNPGSDPELMQMQMQWLLAAMFGGLAASMLLMPFSQAACILLVANSFTGDRDSIAECLGVALRKFFSILAFAILSGLITGIGMIFCLVPGFIFMTWFYVGGAALVIEDLSATGALERSKKLSGGSRWEVFGLFILVALISQSLALAAIGAVSLVTEDALITSVVEYGVGVLSTTIVVVAPVVTYFNLRVRKEAFDTDQLSDVVQAIGRRGARGA